MMIESIIQRMGVQFLCSKNDLHIQTTAGALKLLYQETQIVAY
jgi:hypothetical protein